MAVYEEAPPQDNRWWNQSTSHRIRHSVIIQDNLAQPLPYSIWLCASQNSKLTPHQGSISVNAQPYPIP